MLRKLPAATVLAVLSVSTFAFAAQPGPSTNEVGSSATKAGPSAIQPNGPAGRPSASGQPSASKGQSALSAAPDNRALDRNQNGGMRYGSERGGRYGWEHGRRYGWERGPRYCGRHYCWTPGGPNRF